MDGKAKIYIGYDGNYYYRDTLHTGKRAHLEVFNKKEYIWEKLIRLQERLLLALQIQLNELIFNSVKCGGTM